MVNVKVKKLHENILTMYITIIYKIFLFSRWFLTFYRYRLIIRKMSGMSSNSKQCISHILLKGLFFSLLKLAASISILKILSNQLSSDKLIDWLIDRISGWMSWWGWLMSFFRTSVWEINQIRYFLRHPVFFFKLWIFF